MNLRCFIVDDDPYAIEILKKYIKQTPPLILAGEETDPLKAIQKIRGGEQPPDVIFMDIDMKQMNGLELAEIMKEKSFIIFTTGHPEYAVRAFDMAVVDYLVKPVGYARFMQAIEQLEIKIQAKRNPADDFFFIQDRLKKKKVKVWNRDVVYFEAFHNYIKVICGDKEYTIYISLSDLDRQLPSLFRRIHKSFIINADKIVSVEGNTVLLEGKVRVSIGDSYRKAFFDEMDEKTLKKRPSSNDKGGEDS